MPETDAMLTIAPLPCRSMCGSTCLQVRNMLFDHQTPRRAPDVRKAFRNLHDADSEPVSAVADGRAGRGRPVPQPWSRSARRRTGRGVRAGRATQAFLPPQLAELIVSQGDEKILESHRREIVVFCDLRGYTAFTETAEPEEVFKFLREYHGALGPLVAQFDGTLDHFSGDGIMVFFNDPVPCPDPAERAVKMAMSMREAASRLITVWRRHGCELGFGAGIAQGYATLGQIGSSERSGYTAIGTVCNLAARLCAEAKDGQILVSSRIAEAIEAVATLEDLGNLELK